VTPKTTPRRRQKDCKHNQSATATPAIREDPDRVGATEIPSKGYGDEHAYGGK